jgi:hypothetical protein
MKTFKERLQAAIKKVFGEDKKPSEIKTEEDKQKMAEAYKEMWNTELDEDFEKFQETKQKAEKYDNALGLLAEEESEEEGAQAEGAEGGAQNNNQEPEGGDQKANKKEPGKTVDLNARIEEMQKENKKLKEQNEKLSQETEEDKPEEKTLKIGILGGSHSDTHLFGGVVEHSMFSLDKRWNKIMKNPAVAKTSEPDEDTHEAFQKEVKQYGAKIAQRMQTLQSEGRLNLNKEGALNVDYTNLSNADLGDQFVVRRQDALIARILALPSLSGIFPKRYGIQDKDLITNAFFGEFSQPYQTGKVFKGDMELQPEMGHVDDVMMKTQFGPMKWIERRYIGYLNQEGSDPVKWTMIEWTILQIAEKLTKEQIQRRIRGIFVKPIADTAYHHLHGSTGVIYTLIRYMNEYKLKPFDDAGLSSYDDTSTNMVDAVIAYKNKMATVIEDFIEGDWELLLNAKHRHWYRDQYRSKYGTDNDFNSIIDATVPDSDMKIRWVPAMGDLKFMIAQPAGNIQLLENLPGEMFNIKFQQDMEDVNAWSVWKEGVSAAHVGKKFTSKANLDANNFEGQMLFMNKPAKALSADDTTPDVSDNFWVVTAANGGATAITDLDNKKEGKAYIIEIGSATNASNIAKSGLFSEITAAWDPDTVGDYIMVIWDDTDSKFYELERRESGSRTVNTAKQPNLASA